MGLPIMARIADRAQPLQRRTLRFQVEPGEGTLRAFRSAAIACGLALTADLVTA
jgi:hypothetical protein